MAELKSKALQVLRIEEILPLLASRYEAGCLVPFIGAGMSRRKLAAWSGFLKNLADQAADSGAAPVENPTDPCPRYDPHPEVVAQRVAATIRNRHNEDDFLNIVGKALRGEEYDKPGAPEQTEALAAIGWPLTISTNYDNLFYCACRKVCEDRLPPMVLGRAPEDCKQLMSALVSPFDREIIWHIQGFLGEPCSDCNPGTTMDSAHLKRLRSELVIGHSEYRRAVNTAIHFRRCFGEVFRSRSFLFLGSSLSEEYFWNLFGETLELCGPSPVPHFAFLLKGSGVDVRFLAEEMNIAVCEYDDHADLTRWLKDLKRTIDYPNARVSNWHVPLNGGFRLEVAPYAHLPMPETTSDRAVAIIVRARPEGQFDLDSDLGVGQREELRRKFNQAFAPGRHVLETATDSGIFAVRARTRPESESESDCVGAAVRELLGKLGSRWGFLHLHMPSAGGTVPPVYAFIEVVREFGRWAADDAHQRPLHLIAHVGPQVLLNLTSGQISLHELLTSRLIRFWAMVNSERGAEPARRVLYRKPDDTTLKDVLVEVLGEVGDSALKEWSVSLSPSPSRAIGPLTDKSLDQNIRDVGVVLGSVLTLSRARPHTHGKTLTRHAAVGS